ncbi:protein misato homolog 1-like [Branchiostoma floridae x Branchiostoma belcheri]
MAGSTREVVTLQFGHYANFVGTHWWNVQESSFCYDMSSGSSPSEINHDVLFREGLTLTGEQTYTPRLLLYDLKGSLNTLKEDGTLYDVMEKDDEVHWMGDVTLHTSETSGKNQFLKDLERIDKGELPTEEDASSAGTEDSHDEVQEATPHSSTNPLEVFRSKLYNLDGSVSVWSDFLRIHLHPRTVSILSEYAHDLEQDMFDVFGYGQQLLGTPRVSSDLEDRLHFFVEDCDSLQGFQVLVDPYNGFGGLAAEVLEQMSEDYDNKGILTFGCYPSVYVRRSSIVDYHRLICTVLSVTKLSTSSSLYAPLSVAAGLGRDPGPTASFPYLTYNPTLHYHTAGILAATLDTCTLPYRTRSDAVLMTDLTGTLNYSGRKLAALSARLPFPITLDGSLAASLSQFVAAPDLVSLCPGLKEPGRTFMQSVVLRGVPSNRIRIPDPAAHADSIFRDCRSVNDCLKRYLQRVYPGTLNAGTVVNEPMTVTTPFPHLFQPEIAHDGLVGFKPRSPMQGVEKVPAMTSLSSPSGLQGCLTALHGEVEKLDIRRFHRFLDAGLEEDEFKEAVESLRRLARTYQTGDNEMAEDSDDDSD